MYQAHTKLEALGDVDPDFTSTKLNLEGLGPVSTEEFKVLHIDSILGADGKDSGVVSVKRKAKLDELGEYSGLEFTAKDFDGIGTFDFEKTDAA